MLKPNRSIPDCVVIPEIGYADVNRAAEWLCAAFGFTVRLRIADHRIQLDVPGGGAIVIIEAEGESRQSILVRVDDADAHLAAAIRNGARVVRAPASYMYGERQYTAEDFAGHRWTFSATIADVDPADWVGVV